MRAKHCVRIKLIEVNKWPKSNGKYLNPIYFMNKSIDKRKHNVSATLIEWYAFWILLSQTQPH